MKRSFTIGRRRPNKTVKSGRPSGWNGGTARRTALKCRIQNGPRDLVSLVCLVCLVEPDRPDEPDQPDSLCLARVKNPVLYFVNPPSRFITCRVLDRRMMGT